MEEIVTPTISILGWFTREGRLKNEWALALKSADAADSLRRFHRVCSRLVADPPKTAHLWLPFLDSFVLAKAREFSDSDFQMLDEMVAALGGHPAAGVRPADIWTRAIAARDARGESRQAFQLLTRTYWDPATSDVEKPRTARDLARRGAKGDDNIAVYLDHLKRKKGSADDSAMINLLAGVCATDLASSAITLKRASEAGRALIGLRIRIPGSHRSVGLNALLVRKNADEAITSLEAALRDDSKDYAAWQGLLIACLRAGAHKRIAELLKQPGLSLTPEIADLLKIAKALEWLDSPSIKPAPCLAAELEGVSAGEFAKDSRDAAAGRLHLIEGNARRAVEILGPLADRCPEDVRVAYYASWAAALTGAAGLIARRLASVSQSPGAWTVAALLLDADPSVADKAEVQEPFTRPSQGFLEVCGARLAMACSSPPRTLRWKPAGGPLEEQLEGLRTLLGHSAQTSAPQPVAQWMEVSLFRRLPLADRLFWEGVHALYNGKADAGCDKLEKAAKSGHLRAALVLAVHLLKQNQVDSAQLWLDQGAAARSDKNITLLRAYIDAGNGRGESAVRTLESLASKGNGGASYALGAIYWKRADQLRRTGQAGGARMYWEQAAGTFRAALKSALAPPADCEFLANCAHFILNPASPEAVAALFAALPQTGALPTRATQGWHSWNLMVASLWAETPRLSPELALLDLVESAGTLPLAARDALAQQLAHIAARTTRLEEAEQCGLLIAALAGSKDRSSLKTFERISEAAAARLTLSAGSARDKASAVRQIMRLANADSGNAAAALIAAQSQIRAGQAAEAAAALARANPEPEVHKKLCASLSSLLAGKAPPLDSILRPSTGTPLPLLQACDLLQAASAFVSGEGRGYDSLLAVMQRAPRDLSLFTDPARLLPALCARIPQGKPAPPVLIEAVKKMQPRPGKPSELVSMARCAAALGQAELACRWFEMAIAKNGGGAISEEYVDYLAHLAVVASKGGKWPDAANLLSRAVSFSVNG
jgi:tetratricopeptide (TPR) repeat protein